MEEILDSTDLLQPLNMTEAEKKALMKMESDISTEVDPIAMTLEFDKRGVITGQLKARIYKLFENNKPRHKICTFLLNSLPHQMSMQGFVQGLFQCKYHRLASKIYISLMEVSRDMVRDVCGNRPICRAVHPYLWTLLKIPYNFSNSYETLRALAASPLVNLSLGSDIRQKKAIAAALTKVHGTEAIALAHNTTELSDPRSDIHRQFQKLVCVESSNEATDISYYEEMCKLAYAVGEYAVAEQMQVSAQTRKNADGRALENINLLCTEVHVKLRQLKCSKGEVRHIKDDILMWSCIGLELLHCSSTEFASVWKRLFILQIVSCLLGIDINGNVYGTLVEEEFLEKVKQLLAEFDQCMNGISNRQELLYYIARSRLYECSNNMELAYIYIAKAKNYQTKDVSMAEIASNVQKYEKHLQERHAHAVYYNNKTKIENRSPVPVQGKQVMNTVLSSTELALISRKHQGKALDNISPSDQQMLRTQTLVQNHRIHSGQLLSTNAKRSRIWAVARDIPDQVNLQDATLENDQKPIPKDSSGTHVVLNNNFSQQLRLLNPAVQLVKPMPQMLQRLKGSSVFGNSDPDKTQLTKQTSSHQMTQIQHYIEPMKSLDGASLQEACEQISPCESLDSVPFPNAVISNSSHLTYTTQVLDNLKCEFETAEISDLDSSSLPSAESLIETDVTNLKPVKVLTAQDEKKSEEISRARFIRTIKILYQH